MENEIKDIISSKENIFQNTRLLTMEEISNFRKDMKLKNFDSDLLPVFDFFDNDFICYQAKNKKWFIQPKTNKPWYHFNYARNLHTYKP